MSSFIVKGRLFKYKHIWFENNPEKSGGGYDFLVLHGVDTIENNKKMVEISKQETLISYLDSKDCLWGKLSKTVRNEIRRSEKENTEVIFIDSDKITESLLEDISNIHAKMYEQKGAAGHKVNLLELRSYAENKSLLITKASVIDSLVYHVYLHNRQQARLLISCSLFRNENKDTQNRIGRANKYLHWCDFLRFLELDLKEYDWGGISSITNPNGIDTFKMSFGGEYRSYYNVSIPVSMRARAFMIFKKMS